MKLTHLGAVPVARMAQSPKFAAANTLVKLEKGGDFGWFIDFRKQYEAGTSVKASELLQYAQDELKNHSEVAAIQPSNSSELSGYEHAQEYMAQKKALLPGIIQKLQAIVNQPPSGHEETEQPRDSLAEMIHNFLHPKK